MRNANVVDLYRRVSTGTKVMWLRGDPHTIADDTPVGPWPDVTIGHSANNLMTARTAAGPRDANINPGAAWNETSYSRALY